MIKQKKREEEERRILEEQSSVRLQVRSFSSFSRFLVNSFGQSLVQLKLQNLSNILA